jgi:hypothetical protein
MFLVNSVDVLGREATTIPGGTWCQQANLTRVFGKLLLLSHFTVGDNTAVAGESLDLREITRSYTNWGRIWAYRFICMQRP